MRSVRRRLTSPSRPSCGAAAGWRCSCATGAASARAATVAVALNALPAIEFDPPLPESKRRAIALGQASRGIKLMLRVRGDELLHNAIAPGTRSGTSAARSLMATARS